MEIICLLCRRDKMSFKKYTLITICLVFLGFFYLNTEKNHEFIAEATEVNALHSFKPELSLVLPIEKIFETLHGHHVEEAYQNYTSTGFKKETSFQAFNQFIEEFPIFTNERVINYHSPIIEEGIGNVIIEVKGEKQGLVTLDILLINEENAWKILGFQILPNESYSELKRVTAEDTKDLAMIINQSLKSFAQEDLEKAYHQDTSESFKKGTSFIKFKELIEKNPVLAKHTAVQYSKLYFNNNVATYGIYLTDIVGNKHYLEYDFVREGNQWKILQIMVTGP